MMISHGSRYTLPTAFAALAVATLLTFLLPARPADAQDAPHLTVEEENDGIRLIWTRPGEGGRWAVLKSADEFGLIEDTLGYTSDTTWFDPEGQLEAGRKTFYRVAPWTPSPVPDDIEILEDYDVADIDFEPFDPDYDLDPDVSFGMGGPDGPDGQHLRLAGDTWKTQYLDTPRQLDMESTWRVDAKSDSTSRLQMIGFGDGTDEMWYVLWGEWAPNSDSLIWTYQGWFPEHQWAEFNLPVGEDWHGRFGQHGLIDRIFYVNDSSNDDDQGILLVDNLHDATDAQPLRPDIDIEWQIVEHPSPDSTAVQFRNWTLDEDSDFIDVTWSFGDGTIGHEEHPRHVYPKGGEWPVTFMATDAQGRWDYVHTRIVDEPVTQQRGNFRMSMMGDIILARGIQDRIDQLGHEAIFEGVWDQIHDADLAMANLESPITTSTDGHPTKGILFKSRPVDAWILKDVGYDFLTLANNHIIDYMESGMLETQDILDDLNIPWCGAGINDIDARRPSYVNINQMTLGIVGMSNRDGHYNNYQPYLDAARDRMGFALWNRTGIEQTIPALQDSADLVMAQVHCGSEYSFIPMDGDMVGDDIFEDEVDHPRVIFALEPDSGEVALRQYAIDQGADLVICHHPHVIQGVEVYNGKLIAHCLGNFVFDLSYNETLPSMILNVDVGDNDVVGASVVPGYIKNDLPLVPEGELGKSVLDYLTHFSKLRDTHLTRPAGMNEAFVQFDTTYARDDGLGAVYVPISTEGYTNVGRTGPEFVGWDGYLTAVRVPGAQPGTRVRVGRDILLWGNMEDEGADPWDLNSNNESWSPVAYEGERSVRIMLPDGTWSNYISDFVRRVKLQTEQDHSFVGWIKTMNAGTAQYDVRFYNNRGSDNFDETVVGEIQGTNEWTKVHYDFDDIDPGWNYLNVRCNQYPPDDGDGYAWFDEVNFIEWGEWQEVDAEGMVEVPYPTGHRFLQVEMPEDDVPDDGDILVYFQKQWPATDPAPSDVVVGQSIYTDLGR